MWDHATLKECLQQSLWFERGIKYTSNQCPLLLPLGFTFGFGSYIGRRSGRGWPRWFHSILVTASRGIECGLWWIDEEEGDNFLHGSLPLYFSGPFCDVRRWMISQTAMTARSPMGARASTLNTLETIYKVAICGDGPFDITDFNITDTDITNLIWPNWNLI